MPQTGANNNQIFGGDDCWSQVQLRRQWGGGGAANIKWLKCKTASSSPIGIVPHSTKARQPFLGTMDKGLAGPWDVLPSMPRPTIHPNRHARLLLPQPAIPAEQQQSAPKFSVLIRGSTSQRHRTLGEGRSRASPVRAQQWDVPQCGHLQGRGCRNEKKKKTRSVQYAL